MPYVPREIAISQLWLLEYNLQKVQ